MISGGEGSSLGGHDDTTAVRDLGGATRRPPRGARIVGVVLDLRGVANPHLANLTSEQAEALLLVASGCSQKAMALALGVRAATVSARVKAARAALKLAPRQVLFVERVGGMLVVVPIELSNVRLPTQLSEAERGVILATLAGDSNERIARSRSRSARTVANQLASAYRKLGICSRVELFARAASWSGAEMVARQLPGRVERPLV